MSKLSFLFGLLGLLLLFPTEAQAQGKLTVEDQDGVTWQKATTVDFFDSQSLLAPGSSGEYQFTVKNTGAEKQMYQLKLSEITKADLPLRFKVKVDGKTIHGTTENGQQLAEAFVHQEELSKHQVHTYEIHWHWPFQEDDVRDTLLGKRGTEELTYQIGLALQTEDASLSATSKPQKDSNSSSSPYPLTGEALQYWWTYTGVLLIGCAILIKKIHHKRRVQR